MSRLIYRIVQSLRTALPEETVARTARTTDLVERSCDIGSVPFFWNFLIGSTQPKGSVTKVQDFYEVFTGHDATYSSIQQWITPDLKQLLFEMVRDLSVEVGATEHTLGGRLIGSAMSSSRARLTALSHLIPLRSFLDTVTIMLERSST